MLRPLKIVNNSCKNLLKTASILHTLFYAFEFILFKFILSKKSKSTILAVPLLSAKENSLTLLFNVLLLPGILCSRLIMCMFIHPNRFYTFIPIPTKNPPAPAEGSLRNITRGWSPASLAKVSAGPLCPHLHWSSN